MRYSGTQVVFQEIPNEITLAFQVIGCPVRCSGCHSSDLWSSDIGEDLDLKTLSGNIDKFKNYISCVLFLGGEWNQSELVAHLDFIKASGLKTALYTGLEYDQVSVEIINRLDYLKYGPFISQLGPLSSPITNQKLVNLKTNENLNRYFTHGGTHDSTRCQTDKT